jgi:hypothetical protein
MKSEITLRQINLIDVKTKYKTEMSIAVENLPLPHRRGLKNLTPRRCRAAVL